MVAAVSPADINYEETLSTLRYTMYMYMYIHQRFIQRGALGSPPPPPPSKSPPDLTMYETLYIAYSQHPQVHYARIFIRGSYRGGPGISPPQQESPRPNNV